MGFCHVFFVQWTKQLNHCTSFFSFPTGFVYAPNFLRAAASAKDPVRRFELVMAFAVAGLHFGAKPTRPFEPLLGETLQAALYDGSQIYCEQISSTIIIWVWKNLEHHLINQHLAQSLSHHYDHSISSSKNRT